jgi:hypothetical protein
MIDAMCHDCRFFFGSLLGWKCSKGTQGIEHDPTDQACGKFRRKVIMPFVRQEIPIQVRLTGRVSRWSPQMDAEGNGAGGISSVEAEPQAPCYHTRTVWISVDRLMWGGGAWLGEWDGESVQQEELEQICRYETDVRETMALIIAASESTVDFARVVAEAVVDVARENGVPIAPTDLVTAIKDGERLSDLLAGVSAHSITADLADRGLLNGWGVAGFVEPKP